MHVLALILSVVLVTVLMVVFGVLMALYSPSADGMLVVASIAIGLLVMPPLLVGSWLSFWGSPSSQQARVFTRRSWWVTLGLQTVGAAASFIWASIVGAPWWLPVLFTAVGAGLTALAVPIGKALFRLDRKAARSRDASTGASESSEPGAAPIAAPSPDLPPAVSRAEVRRKIFAITLTFVTGFVAVVAIAVPIFIAVDGPVGLAFLVGAQLGLLAATVTATVTVRPLNRRLRSVVDGDVGKLRTFSRAILRGKGEIEPNEEPQARRYAQIVSVVMSFQLAFLSTLYAALVTGQIPILVNDLAPYSIGMVIVLALVYVALLPVQIRQIRRARRYAQQDPVLSSAGTPEPAPR